MSGLVGVIYAPYAPTQPLDGSQAMPQVPTRPQAFRKNARIDQLTPQDTPAITRSVKRVPLTNPLTKAWLTVKLNEQDADTDALVQLAITTASTAAGQITDDGHSTGTAQIKFTLAAGWAGAIGAGQNCPYDIQLLFQDGTLWTGEKGTVLLDSAVTTVTS